MAYSKTDKPKSLGCQSFVHDSPLERRAMAEQNGTSVALQKGAGFANGRRAFCSGLRISPVSGSMAAEAAGSCVSVLAFLRRRLLDC